MRFDTNGLPRNFLFLLAAIAPGLHAQAGPQTAAGSQAPGAQPAAKTTDQQTAQKPVAQVPLRYVRAKDGGTKVYNLASKNAVPFEDADAKALLAVYAEQAGYLLVEPAAGLQVWIFGEFAKPTDVGIVEITGNGIRMRPLPSSEAQSYHLDAYLRMGDRVRVLGRADAKKPLKEDWIKILAPTGTRAWVSATDTVPVAPGEDVNASWTSEQHAAVAALPVFDLGASATASADATAAGKSGKPKSGEAPGAKHDGAAKAAVPVATTATVTSTSKPGGSGAGSKDTATKDTGAPAAATQKAASPKSDEALAAAEKLFEAAKASPTPDFTAAKAAFQKVVDASPNSYAADSARMRLEQIGWSEEIVRIKSDYSMSQRARTEKLEEAQERLRLASLSQDPLWGRFQVRGWMTRDTSSSSAPGDLGGVRYVVQWGGKSTAELVCTSGRYDLSVFENAEIGIYGAMTRAAIPASGLAQARPPRVDVMRIEVLSGRAEK